ncbi:Uncharacterized conserved protein YgiB, involved in bioifilm formation, UPF0441/DUF1190 family [Arboricoccus pini]|uniref:Uncharacterized conserved protein YgiB, involved in bioifilm formation, UPF0441/DUF1190 family n=1 Tax=Arboricoccus pini TaxID=1963835 RepID=A0A212QMS3_9PROT|nr:DUF1190 domain-containing protein [Arboricoccus pini]SNB60669.1 Uncharacterized conserved protein YgiB, involved in bioifilm formation, UPF0441/DUF1190 family [Arboricoccus pini]
MKRSTAITLTLMAAAGGALAIYNSRADQQAEGNYYPSVEACKAEGKVDPDDCQKAFDEAKAQNDEQAPRFDEQSTCEAQFGVNACYRREEGGSSFFVPFLTGFLVSNLVNQVTGGSGYWGRPGGYHYARPIYRSVQNGDLYTGSGSPLSTLGGSTVRAPARDVYQAPPPSRTSVVSRGGFGSRSSSWSTGSFRSWGS